MCLLTYQTKPSIAKKNIRVYKVFIVLNKDNTLLSPYMHFKYTLNQLFVVNNAFFGINTKNRSPFDNWATEVYRNRGDLLFNVQSYAEGFHSMFTLSRAKLGMRKDENIYECIIPKDSLYFEDETGLIISNQIIVKRNIYSK